MLNLQKVKKGELIYYALNLLVRFIADAGISPNDLTCRHEADKHLLMSLQFHSDASLRQQLQAMGVEVGPITDSTRELYRRLLRKRQSEEKVGSAAKRPRLAGCRGGAERFTPEAVDATRKPRASGRQPDLPSQKPQLPPTGSPRVNVCRPLPKGALPDVPAKGNPAPPSPAAAARRKIDFSPHDNKPRPPPSPAPQSPTGLVSLVTRIGEGLRDGVKKLVHNFPPDPQHGLHRNPSFRAAGQKRKLSPGDASPGDHRVVPLEEVDVGGEGLPVVVAPTTPPSGDKGQVTYDWELMPSDVEICKKEDGSLWRLGRGGFGEVFRGLKDGVDEVAVKVIRIQSSSAAAAQFKEEIDLISKLRHRHVLQFYGACIKPSCLYMVTELMQTDLFTALRSDPRYQWTGIYGKEVAVGVAAGLHYLHSRRPPVVHRDIKSPNILLMDGIAKIADVGIARTKATSDMTAQRGFTIAWAAPEVVYRKRATEKIDIWSFGIILWEVVTGNMPGPGHLFLPPSTPPALRELYSRCTAEDPEGRPGAAELLQALRAL